MQRLKQFTRWGIFALGTIILLDIICGLQASTARVPGIRERTLLADMTSQGKPVEASEQAVILTNPEPMGEAFGIVRIEFKQSRAESEAIVPLGRGFEKGETVIVKKVALLQGENSVSVCVLHHLDGISRKQKSFPSVLTIVAAFGALSFFLRQHYKQTLTETTVSILAPK